MCAPAIALVAALLPSAAGATTYEVGPGRALASISEVPWESLMPGDVVLIHWRATPYNERWVIGRRGTMAAPIVVRGMRGPGGERPVIDGRGATARRQLDWWNEDRGVIKIGGSSVPPDTTPAWIVVEGLEVRSARPPFRYATATGTEAWRDDAASIYVEKGEAITLRDNVFTDSANGLFTAWQTSELLVEGNHVHGNGLEGNIFVHNSYTEANGAVFQYNHYGPLRAGCPGNALKDRSTALVVRYNWIEGGNRQLDLVESDELFQDPDYRITQVYGNVLLEPGDDGNSQIVHYGGDGGDESHYRKGTLYFHHNTVISRRTRSTTLFRLSTNDERVDARNNVVHVTASGGLGILDSTGVAELSGNWLRRGWVNTHGSLAGMVREVGPNLTGTMPAVAGLAGDDFRPAAGGDLIDAAVPLSPVAQVPLRQYVRHQQSEPRPMDAQRDLGAFEWAPPPPVDAGVVDARGLADASEDARGFEDASEDAAGDASEDARTSADVPSEADARTTPDAGQLADASPADAAAAPAPEASGCGCHATTPSQDPSALLLLALLWVSTRRARERGRGVPTRTAPPALLRSL